MSEFSVIEYLKFTVLRLTQRFQTSCRMVQTTYSIQDGSCLPAQVEAFSNVSKIELYLTGHILREFYRNTEQTISHIYMD